MSDSASKTWQRVPTAPQVRSFSRRHRHQQGFTLIEILIVMIIIGILAALSIASFQSSQRKARDTQRKSDLHQIANALETYYNDYGQYPVGSGGQILGCGAGPAVCTWGEPFVDANGTTYMVELPTDPSSNWNYVYISATGDSYQIYARFENTEDAAVRKVSDVPQVYGNLDCGGVGCNYGIASANALPTDGYALTPDGE